MASLLWPSWGFRRALMMSTAARGGAAAAPPAPPAPSPAPPSPSPYPPLPITRIHLATVDSTNTYARARAGGLDPGALTVVTADEQTAGRGRLGRAWSSTGDDIKATFAFALPPAALPGAYLLSPLLSVVAVRALGGARTGVPLGIKWPNDLIAGGRRKVGGILCELEALPGGAYVAVLGIGVNVNSAPAALGVDRPVWPLTTLAAEAGRGAPFDVGALTDALVAAFASALPRFLAEGFAPFQAEYEASSVLLGRRVRFDAGGELGRLAGAVVGFGDDGRLLLALDGAPPGAPPTGFLSGEVSGIALDEGGEVGGGGGV